jgi:AcrR family transcriptional regulator
VTGATAKRFRFDPAGTVIFFVYETVSYGYRAGRCGGFRAAVRTTAHPAVARTAGGEARGGRSVTRTRLTPERENELFQAVLELLREVGYGSLTMDAVAARTRSSKATLYRQWHSKPELVATALQHAQVPGGDMPDTGTLRGDFQAMVDDRSDDEIEKDAALVRGLVHAVYDNPDLHEALRRKVIEPEIRALREVIGRAVERGEVRADNPALEFVPHLLFGLFLSLQIVELRILDGAYLARYVQAVVLPVLEAR